MGNAGNAEGGQGNRLRRESTPGTPKSLVSGLETALGHTSSVRGSQ